MQQNIGEKGVARKNKFKLTMEEYQYLRRIGLSIEAVHLYELLQQKGRLTAQKAASFTYDFPSAEYRLFYDLEKHRLVRRLPGRPRAFEALPLRTGLKSSLQNAENDLHKLIQGVIKETDATDQLEIIIGRQTLYDAYLVLADKAQHEIWLYSIGIAFSEKLEGTQRSAVKRGVSIKHVVQQHKISNQHVISKWQRIGVKLRYHKQQRGFHFFVIDSKQVCITFSNPSDTENRLSILTDNSAAVELFCTQFQNLWNGAKDIA
jgi:sugar-specific transcriptional regulator TrmB